MSENALRKELDRLADAAVETVIDWLKQVRGPGSPGLRQGRQDRAARRLSQVLSHPTGLDFTVGFVDRVIRTEDTQAAAAALKELAELAPDSLEAADLAQIRAGAGLGRLAPGVVVPAARSRMRSMVGHMVVDARERPFGKAVAKIRGEGHRLNINLLGEAVLGEGEAEKHLEDTLRLLRRDDVDYVSVKVSSVASQLSMWGFEATVDYVVDRLAPLYREAAAADAGSAFINLDMEEYRDLRLTIAVFEKLLSLPETKDYEAGIVLQAYLPDALGAAQRLSAFAEQRVASGGAGVKVRLVKGANLPVERAHADLHGWPMATCESKEATDANYKLVLDWLLTEERMHGLRVGVAGHNLFDLAFAHLLGLERGVSGKLEFEMLQGMAADQQAVLRKDLGDLLLYVPAVRPEEFDVAISYLVRRLEENAAEENFMSGIFDLSVSPDGQPGETFRREERRFRASVDRLASHLSRTGHEPPEPAHQQDRLAEEAAAQQVEEDAQTEDRDLPAFVNEPDTNPALEANQRWAEQVTGRATDEWLAAQAVPEEIAPERIDALVAEAREAAVAWQMRPAAERARILYRAAELLAARRGHLISLAAAEAGKSVAQSDPEVSEAIDFARYYAHSALELEQIEHVRFVPDRLVLITPPWNFPLAIPAGGTFAALAAGAAVVHKPSAPTPRCSMAILEALWEAGVPREVLHGVFPFEGEAGRRLVTHEGVDRVILTGASETAALFRSWKPRLRINAETSGKNALVVTPSADRDLAVSDLVSSAFGHAGQKCSAASLGILVGSVYDSERFRRQLADAARSLVVDWPQNLSATVGPLTEGPAEDSEKLHRALTTLEPGESWLVEPKPLDGTGRLWSPGIKEGVRPGSFFHLTECFGPVLGLMRARDLEEAIELQNAVEYGLTGGIHSLEPQEVRGWLDRVQVGNAYVNRGITGAIVQRQSFGGWKRSSVGLGSKAGGPNYVMLFGQWEDAADIASAARLPALEPGDGAERADPAGLPELLEEARSSALITESDRAWLKRALWEDRSWWDQEFDAGRDRTALTAEANVFRYLPEDVVLRLGAGAQPREVLRVLFAAARAGSPVTVSASPEADKPAVKALKLGLKRVELVQALDRRVAKRVRTCDDRSFAEALAAGELSRGVGTRVRLLGGMSEDAFERLAPHPETALLDDPVTASGRVELRLWLKEQAVSMTLHRFGNPSPAFQELAEELTT